MIICGLVCKDKLFNMFFNIKFWGGGGGKVEMRYILFEY